MISVQVWVPVSYTHLDVYKRQDQSCENMQELVLNVQDGEDITVKLNTLLAQARDKATDEKQCKVIVPPGNYTLTGRCV